MIYLCEALIAPSMYHSITPARVEKPSGGGGGMSKPFSDGGRASKPLGGGGEGGAHYEFVASPA